MALAHASRLDGERFEKPDSPSTNLLPNALAGAPLDLSFKCLLNFQEVIDEAQFHKQTNLKRSKESGKLLCNAIRLNNNSLTGWNGMQTFFTEIIETPDAIAWLDLSFNEIHVIDEIITKSKNIRVLYLHGNSIEKIQDVKKLATLPHLRNLTLHGNPIEAEAGYRQFVLSILPGLRTLDFSGVTKQDRLTAETWSAMNRKGSKKRKRSE